MENSRSFFFFLMFLTIFYQSASARSLGNPSSGHQDHHANRAISFYMIDFLREKHPSSRPVKTKVNGQLPFSKPLGFFPPFGGVPLTIPDTLPMTGSSQTLDLEGMTVSFPAIATLQELELGTVTSITEDIYEGSTYGSSLLRKGQGICVASSEDGNSHMMAMTVTLNGNDFKDGLRFFGVIRTDVSESHVAVIGGNGKYQNANGYATLKIVNGSPNSLARNRDEAYKLLKFDVYLG